MKFKNLLVVLIAVGSVAMGEGIIKVGDPESQIVATLGRPQGTAVKNGTTVYVYDGGNVIAKDGKVVEFPGDFKETVQRKQRNREIAQQQKLEQEQFEAEQRAKGLVLYKKQWVTPEKRASLVEAEERRAQLIIQQRLRQLEEDRLRNQQAQVEAELKKTKAELKKTKEELTEANGALARQARETGYRDMENSNMESQIQDLQRREKHQVWYSSGTSSWSAWE